MHRKCVPCSSASSRSQLAGVQTSHPHHRRSIVSHSGPDGNNMVNEDVLARLRAAEEEASKLRKQLELAQAAKGAPTADVIAAKPKRIDSTDDRETLFTSKPKRSSWLSEADVEFFVGNSVGETSSSAAKDAEADAVVQRRLLIGGALTVGALAFALVPTESLRPKPSKPLYVYLVPLLRIQDLLAEAGSIIEDGNWEQLRLVLSRIQGPPNNVRENLRNVVALLDGSVRSKASTLASDINEYLDDMDYNKYFDQGWTTKTLTGAQNAEFVKFSSKARAAAQQNLSKFLQLVPREALQQAFDANRIPDQ